MHLRWTEPLLKNIVNTLTSYNVRFSRTGVSRDSQTRVPYEHKSHGGILTQKYSRNFRRLSYWIRKTDISLISSLVYDQFKFRNIPCHPTIGQENAGVGRACRWPEVSERIANIICWFYTLLVYKQCD